MEVRKQGERRAIPKAANRRDDPFATIGLSGPGEVRVSTDRMAAIQHLYNTSPSIQAARSILHGQLLSSGIRLRRAGADVELAEPFQRHLQAVWLPFARDVIDSFLQFGFVLVAIDEEEPAPFANLMAVSSQVQRKRKVESAFSSTPVSSNDVAPARSSVANFVPFVPELGSYEISWTRDGYGGYRRRYTTHSTSVDNSYREDAGSALFFRTPPDGAGNINSPVAAVFDSASFVSALVELALNAEVVRARSQIVTQPVPRQTGSHALDPANLFFDSESRAIQAGTSMEDSSNQASNLNVAVQACQVINRMQSTVQAELGSTPARASHVPPEVRALVHRSATPVPTRASHGADSASALHRPRQATGSAQPASSRGAQRPR